MKPLRELLAQPGFADIDRHFAHFIGTFGDGFLAELAAALASRNVRAGNICLDLHGDAALPDFAWPTIEQWRAGLADHPAFGDAAAQRPLVLDEHGRLYLRRYWEYQDALATAILQRCAPSSSASLDAVQTALTKQLTIISGGPGTGKTTTVKTILERKVAEPGGDALRIALTAPTGKAAARLQESLGATNDAVRRALVQPAATINRLLGTLPNSIYFRHHARNPLVVDLVVVDEASMVSLTMMAKLFDALPAQCRVILLGDCAQLASVEAGAVLGDLAEAAAVPGSALQSHLVVLRKNYRFSEESSIHQLCGAVATGDSAATLALLQGPMQPDVSAHTASAAGLNASLEAPVVAGYRAYLSTEDPALALERFQQFRLLCALRVGPFGAVNLNRQIAEILARAGLLKNDGAFYRGLPVLITRNDYQLGLFNGDTGILLPESPGSGTLAAWFTGADGKLRALAPARLPEHEPAFAMTVHKSQGSEFENVLLLLPDTDNPVLTRELVYTGLTRARKHVACWFHEPVLRAAIERKTERFSGLRDRLLAASNQA